MATLQNVVNDLRNLPDAISSAPINTNTLSQPSTLSFVSADVAAAAASAVPVAPTTAAPGAPYSAMYAFGDSLTDTGNVSLATLGMVPVSPPYADRSFTNGPVWAQDLAQSLGLPALKPSLAGGTDFAYGGAETGQTPAHTLNATDLPSQYSQFLTQVPSPQAGALYAVWIGSNDVLDIANNSSLMPDQQQADVGAAVSNEMSVINGLVSHGAQNLLVLNVPDIGKTPYEMARGPAVAQSASSLATLYDTDLAAALQPSGALKVDLVDTFSVLNQVNANPGNFGFTNVTDPVWNGNLTDSNSGTLAATGAAQNQFLFFDSLHPTAQAHSLLASGIAQGLTGVA
jgi:phospholipase/lecithinase/hemolysin